MLYSVVIVGNARKTSARYAVCNNDWCFPLPKGMSITKDPFGFVVKMKVGNAKESFYERYLVDNEDTLLKAYEKIINLADEKQCNLEWTGRRFRKSFFTKYKSPEYLEESAINHKLTDQIQMARIVRPGYEHLTPTIVEFSIGTKKHYLPVPLRIHARIMDTGGINMLSRKREYKLPATVSSTAHDLDQLTVLLKAHLTGQMEHYGEVIYNKEARAVDFFKLYDDLSFLTPLDRYHYMMGVNSKPAME